MPPEEDDAGNEAGDGDDNGRQQGEDAGDDELRVEEAAARDGADEPVAGLDGLDADAALDERGHNLLALGAVELERDAGRLPFEAGDAGQRLEELEGAAGVVDLDVDAAAGADELVDAPGGDEAAVVHNGGVGTDLLELGQDVAGEEDRHALGTEPADELADLAHFLGVEADGGLVEDEELGLVEEGLGESE